MLIKKDQEVERYSEAESTGCSLRGPRRNPSFHVAAANHIELQFQELLRFLLPSLGSRHVHGVQHAGNTPKNTELVMTVHAFNLSAQESETGGSL